MRMFNKNQTSFAVILILIYVIGESLMINISQIIGIAYLPDMIFAAVMAVVLFIFIRKNKLMNYLGIKKPEISAKTMLFYIPFVLIGGFSSFFGVGMEYAPLICVFHTVTMLFVGFIEEVIFRGFLFRAMAQKNLKSAVIVSSVTFGAGHIINLFNGSNIADNIIQIIYAVAVGFLLVLTFMRTSSLIPCIAFHSFNNCMTAFGTADILYRSFDEVTATLILLGGMLIITSLYLIYIIKLPKRELPEL